MCSQFFLPTAGGRIAFPLSAARHRLRSCTQPTNVRYFVPANLTKIGTHIELDKKWHEAKSARWYTVYVIILVLTALVGLLAKIFGLWT